ncbi:unnamed protein product, partial [marine sediment metagenome]
TNKSINDSYKVGQDVDNITRATITIEKICEILKKSSFKMHQYYFGKGSAKIKTEKIIPIKEAKGEIFDEEQKRLINLKNKHIVRLAKIGRIEEIAREKNNKELLKKVKTLRELENKQYTSELKKIKVAKGSEQKKIKTEKIILNPKWDIKKANEKLIKDQIKSGNLSQKEADYYKKIEQKK